jgi:hypothetical protein
MTHEINRDTLRQIRTALAAMLCADEEHCPTLREARMLCVEAIRLLNTKLNTELPTKNTTNRVKYEHRRPN